MPFSSCFLVRATLFLLITAVCALCVKRETSRCKCTGASLAPRGHLSLHKRLKDSKITTPLREALHQ